MLKGFHRGLESDVGEQAREAWVAEAPGASGAWLSEAEYRAGGYDPDFDRLPVLGAECSPIRPVDMDALPPDKRDYLRRYLEANKNT